MTSECEVLCLDQSSHARSDLVILRVGVTVAPAEPDQAAVMHG